MLLISYYDTHFSLYHSFLYVIYSTQSVLLHILANKVYFLYDIVYFLYHIVHVNEFLFN